MKEEFKYLEATIDRGYRGKDTDIFHVLCDNPDDYRLYYIVIDAYCEPNSDGVEVCYEKRHFFTFSQTESDPLRREGYRIHPLLVVPQPPLHIVPILREFEPVLLEDNRTPDPQCTNWMQSE